MSVFRQLLIVEAVALLALLIVAVAMAAYGAIDSLSHSTSLLSPLASAKIGFGYTLALGVLPVALIGAPGYVTLLRKQWAQWPYVLALGAVPGVAALPLGLSLSLFAIICGSAVALLTHLMCHRLGPNNSFKPRPLRGSA